jgi:hypothetical protein
MFLVPELIFFFLPVSGVCEMCKPQLRRGAYPVETVCERRVSLLVCRLRLHHFHLLQ